MPKRPEDPKLKRERETREDVISARSGGAANIQDLMKALPHRKAWEINQALTQLRQIQGQPPSAPEASQDQPSPTGRRRGRPRSIQSSPFLPPPIEVSPPQQTPITPRRSPGRPRRVQPSSSVEPGAVASPVAPTESPRRSPGRPRKAQPLPDQPDVVVPPVENRPSNPNPPQYRPSIAPVPEVVSLPMTKGPDKKKQAKERRSQRKLAEGRARVREILANNPDVTWSKDFYSQVNSGINPGTIMWLNQSDAYDLLREAKEEAHKPKTYPHPVNPTVTPQKDPRPERVEREKSGKEGEPSDLRKGGYVDTYNQVNVPGIDSQEGRRQIGSGLRLDMSDDQIASLHNRSYPDEPRWTGEEVTRIRAKYPDLGKPR